MEETTRLFAEVQAAYEVLSDPQEKAWYDSHREAILRDDDDAVRGGGGGGREGGQDTTSADDLMRLFSRFHGRSIDLSDSATGFFSVLRSTFDTLAREEDMHADRGSGDDDEVVDYPSFGHAHDDYEDVVKPFYAAWTGFSTRKTYAWEEQFRYSEAPDRRVRRAMEKENRRVREAAVRDFNEAVRSLVAFVRKRDLRYLANSMSEEDRQRNLRDAAAAQAARSRAANQARFGAGHVEPEWARSAGGPDEGEEAGDGDDDGVVEQFECAACGKIFKSERQWQAHERSKKHIKTLQRLTWQLRKEDKALGLSDASLDEAAAPLDGREPSLDEGGLPLHEGGGIAAAEQDDPSDEPADSDRQAPPTRLPRPMDHLNITHGAARTKEDADADEEDEEDKCSGSSRSAKDEDGDDQSGDYAPREQIESRILGPTSGSGSGSASRAAFASGSASSKFNSTSVSDDGNDDEQSTVTSTADADRSTTTIEDADPRRAEERRGRGAEGEEGREKAKGNKAREKRARKAAAVAAAAAAAACRSQTSHTPDSEAPAQTRPLLHTPHTCSACSSAFASKTKLFAHLKDMPAHAQPLSSGGRGRGKRRGER